VGAHEGTAWTNDAARAADIAILTEQQPGERPAELFRNAHYVVNHVDDVLPIVLKLLETTI
jgi:soluble P-type ATPase